MKLRNGCAVLALAGAVCACGGESSWQDRHATNDDAGTNDDATGGGARGADASNGGASTGGSSGGPGSGGAGSSSGSSGGTPNVAICAPAAACGGITHCTDTCYGAQCCFVSCTCSEASGLSGELVCTMSC